MESIQQIKARIGSISGTRQITQSMRLVASAKVQKTRARMEAGRPYLERARRLCRLAAAGFLPAGNRYLDPGAGRRGAVVVISGDRGLCGGYNTGAVRLGLECIRAFDETRIITLGEKARDALRRRRGAAPDMSLTGLSEHPYYADAAEIAGRLVAWFLAGDVDEVHVVYTEFYSMLRQEPVSRRLLPLRAPEGESLLRERNIRRENGDEALLEQVVPAYVAAELYGAMLEAAVCEQSARVTSMDAAAKNADEIIGKLRLRYNQVRQGAITRELTEIVAGARGVSEKK